MVKKTKTDGVKKQVAKKKVTKKPSQKSPVKKTSSKKSSAQKTAAETAADNGASEQGAAVAGKERVGLLPNQIIRASAGTGKTFALSNRYLVLLCSGVECHSILATTFTRKGAGEILDRIIQRLSMAALSPSAAASLSKELDYPVSQDHALSVLHSLLKNLHRLEVSTLDSFFSRIGKVFSLELGLPPVWDVVEEQQMDALRDLAVQSVLRNDQVETLLHMMDKGESTRRVATAIDQIVKKIYEVFRDSDAEAWNRLEEPKVRLSDEQLETLKLAWAGMDVADKRLSKACGIIAESLMDDQWDALLEQKIIQRVIEGDPTYYRKPLPDDVLQMMQQIISQIRWWITLRLMKRNGATYELLRQFGEFFEAFKNRSGQLRFDDVTDRLKHFMTDASSERFSFRLDNQIQHLLLDEFQDTAPKQWSIVKPFADLVTREQDDSRSFFCVGDLKQAIYGWRGGVAEIFNLVEQDLDNLQPTTPLLRSYRSSPVVIDLVNHVFSRLEQYESGDRISDGAVHQWRLCFDSHETARTELEGFATVEFGPDAPEKDADGNKHHFSTVSSLRNELALDTAVEKVITLTQTLPDHHSIGVLVRSNDEIARVIFALQSAGVDASEEGGNALTDSAAVNMVLSALTLADHPADDIARFHVSHGPLAAWFGLEPEGTENRRSNLDAVSTGAAAVRRRLVEDGYGPTIESMAMELAPLCTRRERQRLQHLVRLSFGNEDQQQQWALRPAQFVDHIQSQKVGDQSSAQVRVMTVHKSKGLEFDAVVLPMKNGKGWSPGTPDVVVGRPRPTEPADLVTRYVSQAQQQLLPAEYQAAFSEQQRKTIYDELCVLYVAMTRAAHALHVILPFGTKVDRKTPAAVLLATLNGLQDRDEGDSCLYEAGNPQWFEAALASASDDDVADEAVEPSAEIDDQLTTFYHDPDCKEKRNKVVVDVRSGRGISKGSASSIGASQEMQVADVFEQFGSHGAMERGRLLHGCFELLQWSDDGLPETAVLRPHLQSICPGSPMIAESISQFFSAIRKDPLAKLIDRGEYVQHHMIEFDGDANRLEVLTEHRFAVLGDANSFADGNPVGEQEEPTPENIPANVPVRYEPMLMEGIVDRLVLVYCDHRLVAADVIDFKTDRVTSSQVSQRVNRHRPQMAAYRAAIARQLNLPIERVGTRLAFIATGDVVNIDVLEATIGPDSVLTMPPKGKVNKDSEDSSSQSPKKRSTKQVVETTVEDAQLAVTHAERRKRTVDQGKGERTDNSQQGMLWDD